MKKSKFLILSISALFLLIVIMFLSDYLNSLNDEAIDNTNQIEDYRKINLDLISNNTILKEENENIRHKETDLISQLNLKEDEISAVNDKYNSLLEKLGITTKDYFGNPITISDFEYIGSFKNGDQVFIEPYTYNFQEAAWRMLIVRDDLIIEYVPSFPSKAKFNEDRTKILYSDSLQFEVIGNVAIYDSEKREISVYTKYGYDGVRQTVKDVEWYDEKSVLCIVGFDSGTITQGGLLYYLDLETEEMIEVLSEQQLLEWTSRPFEVVDVLIDGDELIITLVEWSDDNYMYYFYTSHKILISETNIK